MNQSERRRYLIQELLNEQKEYSNYSIPEDSQGQKDLLRGLLNVRAPKMLSREFLKIQDEYLKEETEKKGITELADLTPVEQGIYLWQGDITTLRCDAIVNAANSGMTGCYAPNHKCIDNCIHTFAGAQLRYECAQIAVRTVREFLQKETSVKKVIFNVFKDYDREIYEHTLAKK